MTTIKRPAFEALIVTLSAGVVTAALSVACAPTHDSYSKDQPVPPATALTSQPSGGGNSPLSGDWICKSGESCTYSMISLASTSGSQDTKAIFWKASEGSENETQNAAQFTFLTENGHIRFNVKMEGAQATALAGDLEINPGQAELVINGEHYVRKSAST
jgi:hypothetical protein